MHVPHELPVADYVRFFGANAPDTTALVDGELECSYRELDLHSNQVANGIIALGCNPGDRVGFLGVNSAAYVEVYFGATKANATYVGLNWRLAPVELEYILNDAGVRIVFCDPELLAMTESLKDSVPGLKHVISAEAPVFTEWRDRFPGTDPGLPHAPADLVVQFYTSGTTGKPKGVCLSNACMSEHRRVEGLLGDWYIQGDPQEVIINAMPNFHVSGLGWLLMGIFHGARIVLMPAPDPGRFLDLIEEQKVTHLFAVPVVLGQMLEEQKKQARDLSSLKVLHYGAAPIPPAMLREAIEILGCGFCQYYGMTEANGAVTVLSPEEHDLQNPERLKSVGRAFPGTQIKIIDAEGRELPTGTDGEICIKSDYMMEAYWNRPEATAEVLVDGWYRSGDGGRMDAEGFIFLGDRIKDMVISGGENIYPTEVENALYEHPAVAEVAVVGVPDEKWGEAVKGVVVLAEGKTATPEELIRFLRDRLAGYKIPRQYAFVDALPRTASGKIKKFELRG